LTIPSAPPPEGRPLDPSIAPDATPERASFERGAKRSRWVVAEPAEVEKDEEANQPVGALIILGLFGALLYWGGLRPFVVVMGLFLMIMLHELGHFVAARWAGIKVTQFFVFMGPRVYSFKRGETEYGIRLLPLGGFVRIIGMHNLDPVSAEDQPRSFMAASYPKRMLVMTAGSLMHMVQAVILFVVLSSVIGVDDYGRWAVDTVSELEQGETPAVVAGLVPGETVVSANGVPTEDFRDLQTYLSARPGEEVTLEIVGDAGTRTVDVVLAEVPTESGETIGFLGVAPTFEKTRLSPMVGVENFGIASWEVLKAVPRLLSPSTFVNLAKLMADGSQDVAIDSDEAATRPISIYGAVRYAGQPDFDWAMPISMLALINLFVGFFNMVPLLPLDGGHVALATYERIRSRNGKRYHVDVAKLLPVTWAVVTLLGFLMIATLYLDVARPIG